MGKAAERYGPKFHDHLFRASYRDHIGKPRRPMQKWTNLFREDQIF